MLRLFGKQLPADKVMLQAVALSALHRFTQLLNTLYILVHSIYAYLQDTTRGEGHSNLLYQTKFISDFALEKVPHTVCHSLYAEAALSLSCHQCASAAAGLDAWANRLVGDGLATQR
jgi:hypothetical protein